MVQTPVLFETFARVNYARQVFDALKANKPKKLYFYSNKARTDRLEEIRDNEEIRSWVNEVDWDCELHTFFREEYTDIYTSLKGALDWVFSSEPEAIVLEDDCVPTSAFFSFCDQMIDKYRDNKKVWCISGDNFLGYKPKDADYFFSQYHFMWGWASWSDRWQQITWDTLDIDTFYDKKIAYDLYKTKRQARNRNKKLVHLKKKVEETKCWDYAFGFIIDINQGVTVHPNEHLVTQVGLFGTHSKNAVKTLFHVKAKPSCDYYKIEHWNENVVADKDFDYILFKKLERYKSFWVRLYRYLYRKVIFKITNK